MRDNQISVITDMPDSRHLQIDIHAASNALVYRYQFKLIRTFFKDMEKSSSYIHTAKSITKTNFDFYTCDCFNKSCAKGMSHELLG